VNLRCRTDKPFLNDNWLNTPVLSGLFWWGNVPSTAATLGIFADHICIITRRNINKNCFEIAAETLNVHHPSHLSKLRGAQSLDNAVSKHTQLLVEITFTNAVLLQTVYEHSDDTDK
jgi:hypothetical protein